jgi:hypothetical protein
VGKTDRNLRGMTRNRVIVEFNSTGDAKKVEETVKTGYAETSIENLVHWVAVEEDLVDSYGRLAESTKDPASKAAFRKLQEESTNNIKELSGILRSLEGLDRARIRRIELLEDLHS